MRECLDSIDTSHGSADDDFPSTFLEYPVYFQRQAYTGNTVLYMNIITKYHDKYSHWASSHECMWETDAPSFVT